MATKIDKSKIVVIHQAPTGRYFLTRADAGCLREEGVSFCRISEALEFARTWGVDFVGWTHYQRGSRVRKL